MFFWSWPSNELTPGCNRNQFPSEQDGGEEENGSGIGGGADAVCSGVTEAV